MCTRVSVCVRLFFAGGAVPLVVLHSQAQHIKNFKSQRWQVLLGLPSYHRLLLTGTPLQNSLMELWSLMHFLMPDVFASHQDFKEWFANPLTGMIEGTQEYNHSIVQRLHKVSSQYSLPPQWCCQCTIALGEIRPRLHIWRP